MVEALQILERLISEEDGMAPEVARGVLSLRFSESENARYLSLAERHNNGELSPDELKELEGYVDVGTFLTLVQSKARQSLAKRQPAA